MKNKLKIFIASIMPGIFIIGYNVGTGSVTSMSKAGANFDYDLLWTVLVTGMAYAMGYMKAALEIVIDENGYE